MFNCHTGILQTYLQELLPHLLPKEKVPLPSIGKSSDDSPMPFKVILAILTVSHSQNNFRFVLFFPASTLGPL